MSKPSSSSLLTLLIQDQEALVLDVEGRVLSRIPHLQAGPERRHAWLSALRALELTRAEVRMVLAQSELDIECQEVPPLSRREQRDVADRTAVARGLGFEAAAVLDMDTLSETGHVLWVATQRKADMADWCQAIQGSGHAVGLAVPFQRLLLQGLEASCELPEDRMVLMMGAGTMTHLAIYQGRSLQVLRSFELPKASEDAEEVLYGEVNRLLQFFKQKHRGVKFEQLLVVGSEAFSPAFENRLQGTLKLAPEYVSREVWPVLDLGFQAEQRRSDALNLVPIEIQEAMRRRLFKGLFWLSALAMGVLLGGASVLLLHQEREMRVQAEQAELMAARRSTMSQADEAIVQQRLPLLRLRSLEARQAKSIQGLAGISTVIFEPPKGIELEKVEVSESPEGGQGHHFTIVGLAYTDAVFSVGPLAQYLQRLVKAPGVHLAPVRQVQVSDRMLEGQTKLDQRAVTRFTLEGTAP